MAFAEKQATHAFFHAAEIFSDVDEGVKRIWRTLAREEQKHLQWLLWRMEQLNVSVSERPLSIALWKSFDHCSTPQKFADFMANAEERGRIAGEQFYQTLLSIDPITARIFQQIAIEEQEHIRLAQAILDHGFKIPSDFPISIEGLAEAAYHSTFF